MATKPTETPNWATDHTVNTSMETGGVPNAVVRPPAAKIQAGWQHSEAPPFSFFNWLAKLTGQWIEWLQDFGKTHVHDGGATDKSATKVNFTDHLDYGTHGNLAVITDSGATHKIKHTHSGAGVAELETFKLVAEQIETSEIFQIGASSTTLKNKNPALPAWLQVDGPVQSMGASAAVLTPVINTNSVGALDVIDVLDNPAFINSASTPVAMGVISSGTVIKGHGIVSASESVAGTTIVTLSAPIGGETPVILVTIEDSSDIRATFETGAGNTISVFTRREDGTPNTSRFSIVVFLF